MATPNIVPRLDTEGGLGTAAKSWGKLFINQAASQSTPAVTIENSTVNQYAMQLDHHGTATAAVRMHAGSQTSGNLLELAQGTTGIHTGASLYIDYNNTVTGNQVNPGLIHLDYDKTNVITDGSTCTVTGQFIDMVDAATNHANATVNTTGQKILVDSASDQGTIVNVGSVVQVTDGDTNDGIRLTVEDGGNDLTMYSSADATNYSTWATTADGETKIATIDGSGTAADFTFDLDGAFTVDTQTGTNYWRFAGNANDYLKLTLGSDGEATFTTIDAAAAAAHFEIEADGNIILDAAGDIALEAAGANVTIDAPTAVTGAVTSTNYRTIYVDAGAMVPAATNGADAGTEETHATNFTTLDYLAFDKATEEYADFKLVMPEQYNNGTIKAKFYWKPADAEGSVNVIWGIKAYAATDSDPLTGASGVWGTAVEITDASLNTADDLHISPTTADITIAGTPAADKLVFFRVYRKAADGSDDYDDDAELLGVNIQYQEQVTVSAAW